MNWFKRTKTAASIATVESDLLQQDFPSWYAIFEEELNRINPRLLGIKDPAWQPSKLYAKGIDPKLAAQQLVEFFKHKANERRQQ